MNNVGQFTDPTGQLVFLTPNGGQYLVPLGSSGQPSPLYNQSIQQNHYQSQFRLAAYQQMQQHHQHQLQQQQQQQLQQFQQLRLPHPISSQQLQRLQIVGHPIIQQMQQQFISQHTQQQQQQSQLPPQTIQEVQTPTPPQQSQQQQQQQKIKTPQSNAPRKDETHSNGHKPTKNQSIQAKLQNVKREKCITHYIDGQIIIETSRPLSEKKAKKKKELKQQQQPVQQQQQQVQQQVQQQPQHPQHHEPQPQPQLQQQPQSQPKPLQQQTQPQPRPQPRPQPPSMSQPMPPPPPPLPHLPPQQYQQQQQQVHSQSQLPQQQARPQPLPAKAQNQRSHSPTSIRAEMPNWSVTDVVRFIEQHEDIKQYAEKFREDEVDGKALLLMIDRNLKLEVLTSMFRYGPAMKVEATLSKYKLND